MGQNLIVGAGYGLDLFALAGILSDLVRRYVGFVDDFTDPLTRRDGIGRQNQRRAAQSVHDAKSDESFAGAARQDDDSTAAARTTRGVENVDCFLLVRPETQRTAT